MVQKLIYSFIAKLLQILPLSCGLFIGRRLGDLCYSILRIRRRVVLENLRFVFGAEKSKTHIRHIAKRTYQNFGMTLIEFIRFPVLQQDYVRQHIGFHGKEHLDSVLQANKGAIVITAHFNNWELMGAVHTLMKYKVIVFARELRNSVVNTLVIENRKKVGMEVITKKYAARDMIKALRYNYLLAFLIDQDARNHGIFVDFFGKSASTFRGAAAFAVKTNTPILPMFIVRESNMNHTIYIEPPLLPNPEAHDEQSEIFRLTQTATKLLEAYIRKYPDQYFWFHRRWKTQPNST
ncbi:MAG: lysophospholipid acyltransferase family protein [bacterium]|nr:lysophospholipid acyltransferase family protein [bacterium]